MFRIRAILPTLVLAAVAVSSSAAEPDTVTAEKGDIRITPVLHGSLLIEHAGQAIYVDPWSRGDYTGAATATLLLVTDIHGDHLDIEMIAKLRDEGATLIVPSAAADQVDGEMVLANGARLEVAGILVEAVPMYNLRRGPEEGGVFHEKGRGNGYILTLGGRRIYIAGDTECVPEIEKLENIDVAFMPMNLPYTMPPDEAARCVRAFKPKIVYPYHYRGSNLEEFSSALADVPGIEVRIRDWYPATD